MVSPLPTARHFDLALALLGVTAAFVFGALRLPGWGWSAVLCCCLVLRSKAPIPFLALTTGISSVHFIIDSYLLFPGDLVPLIGVHAVASLTRCRTRHIGLVAGAAFLAVIAARRIYAGDALSDATSLVPMVMITLSILGVWALGMVSGYRADQLKAVRERSVLVERDALAKAQLAVYEERERINDEIHDVLAHTLTGVIVQAESGAAVALEPETTELFSTIAASSRAALSEIRQLLAAGEVAEPRPAPCLDDLDELFQSYRRSNLEIEVQQMGRAVPLGAGISLAIYRVVQESLTNALRHGSGRGAKVRICWGEDDLTITITNPKATGTTIGAIGSGRGLVGIRRRCALYGGIVEVSDGEEFKVHTVWPVSPSLADPRL